MTSKELLAEVLKDKTKHQIREIWGFIWNSNDLFFKYYPLHENPNVAYQLIEEQIKIDKLTNNYKEWLWTQSVDFNIFYFRCHSPCRRVVEVELHDNKKRFRGKNETETEAIINACEWFFNQKRSGK